MKIIDLLNKIANGEEVPEKIKVQGYIWTYEENFKQYKNEDFRELVKALLGYYSEGSCCLSLYGALNCEVELIEEQQDIDIQELKELTCEEGDYKTRTINEIIEAVKQLDRKINKE